MTSRAKEVLRRTFGYEAFRGQQAAVIEHTLAGGDSLVLMPTGGGKSLCYQIPSMLMDGVGVVISPLIALMQDQVDALVQAGVKAACLNSSLSLDEMRDVEDALRRGQLDLVYVSPERLLSERFLALVDRLPVALFAIDEAHCVSQWGHDFRPEYRQLSLLHERFPGVPRIALTATADDPTRREIQQRLGLVEAPAFIDGFDRPNIRYHVVPKNKARDQLLAFLQAEHAGDAGIVYCLSRKKVDDTAAWLQVRGFKALPYHAGMDARERTANQTRFLLEEGVIVVATIAFGMGIDKPNVRFVAHLNLPKSLEAYYQETGRSGRDGLAANAWMSYGLNDVVTLRQMVERSEAGEERKRLEASKLDAMLGYCEVTGCRRQTLLSYFGEDLAEPCGNCDNCLNPVQTWDGTDAARKAMSCIYRTGQRFGASYVTDVLLGKDNDRIRRFGHDKLSTYGIGKELTAAQWRSVLRQLVASRLLSVDMEGYGGLRLTEGSRPVLRGDVAVELRQDQPGARKARAKRRPSGRDEGYELPEPSAILWEALRECRMEFAKAQGVPPYVIFHDATLREMASTSPVNLDELADVAGVGEKKLQRYGEAFLDVIRAHL